MSAAPRRRPCSPRSCSSIRSTSTSTSASRTCCACAPRSRGAGSPRTDLKQVPVEVGLQTETGYPHKGTLDYARAHRQPVDRHAGGARRSCRTPSACCCPAISCACAFRCGEPQNALLVPDAAIGSDQGGRYVLVVNKDNVVEQRKVEIGPLVDDMRVIDKGLERGRPRRGQRPAARRSRARRSSRRCKPPPRAGGRRRALTGRP